MTYTMDQIRDLRESYPELKGLNNSSIDEHLMMEIIDNRIKAAQMWKLQAAQRAQEAYDAEKARYKTKNPTGRNANGAALRKAREIWAGFGR